MKVIGVKNYGSIPHLSSSKLGAGDHFISDGQEKILTQQKRDKHDLIHVLEKYDGSNVGIAKKEGRVYPLTRSGYNAKESKYSQHRDFAEWVYERINFFNEIIPEGCRIVGEWLGSPMGIEYNISDGLAPIVFYDVFLANNSRLNLIRSIDLFQSFGLSSARVLHSGESVLPDNLISTLNDKDSRFKAKEDPEGMVYRVERKGVFDFAAKVGTGGFPNG